MLLLSIALAANCATPTTASELLEVLDAADAAYTALDEQGFLDNADRVLIRTPCLESPASRLLSARIHRLVALRRWGDAPAIARQSLLAAARAAPELGVVQLVGEAHPLATGWSQTPTPTIKMPKPRGHELWVDGAAGRSRPVEQPALVQLLPASGPPVFTALLSPTDPLPRYEAIPKLRAPLRWTALATTAASAGTYGFALSQAARFDNDLTADELRTVQSTTNGSIIASGTLASGAVGALVASFLVR